MNIAAAEAVQAVAAAAAWQQKLRAAVEQQVDCSSRGCEDAEPQSARQQAAEQQSGRGCGSSMGSTTKHHLAHYAPWSNHGNAKILWAPDR